MVRNRLRDAILLALEKAVDGYVVFEDFYANPRQFAREGLKWEYPKSNISKAISRLRQKGLVEKVFDEGKVIVRLTEAGREWTFFNKGDDDLVDWDGLWRIVIFDIPEKHSRVRNILRRRLKEWGFVRWQKSVWASKKPLTDHLRDLVKKLEIEEWVLIFESKNIGR